MNNKQSLKDISPTTQAILLAIETVESTPEIISQENTSPDTQNTDLNKDSSEKKKYYTSVPSFVFHGIASLVLLCMSIHSASADSIFAAALFDVAEEISV
ncbi:MAG: hypothetical protein U9Q15_01485 [Patescibacteria group bacterium]|nr:hypothetical protein [Patescibacteria group bacterium]